MSSAPTSVGQPLLEFRDVDTYYGELHVLKKVNYEIRPGEIVCLLGGNASGKSTTMKTVLGLVRPVRGKVLFRGEPVNTVPTSERVRRGIAPV
ncbi:MAG TPA: ATP-binding cassette domain-containing protein, partial [bacterium]|nr:ATP-binding cassette domain-containing protein [bacterium]